MVRLWRLFQGGELQSGHLPEAGGIMDQAAIMLDCFALMTKAEKALKPPKPNR